MTEQKCGNCKYMGEKNGQYIQLPNRKIKLYHICKNEKSDFDVCIATATGCEVWEKDGEQT